MFTPKKYTVENVRRGHPDKVCDQISDAILDAYLTLDPKSRVAVESFGAHGTLTIGGEITSTADISADRIAEIARGVYRDIGFQSPIEVVQHMAKQSPEIADGVDRDGAGDQGIMYGYAINETKEYLPQAVVYSARIAEMLDSARIHAEMPWLLPDGKTQVTIENGKVTAIVVSVQHTPETKQETIISEITEKVLKPIFGEALTGAKIIINPSGMFSIGGFDADTGLTGRKIMIDSYGGAISHGGGAFSGKDATKVDRSGAYMARFAAKNLVAAGYGKEILVSVAYAIGQAEPVMLEAINEEGKDLSDVLKQHFDFRPKAIIERLGLRNPIYKNTAYYGHFYKSTAPWEQVIVL